MSDLLEDLYTLTQKVGDLERRYLDSKMFESDLVPEGTCYVVTDWGNDLEGRSIIVGKLTGWSIRHDGRWPLLSRYTAGERERRIRR